MKFSCEMNKPPIHPNQETEFDPQINFAQFLKEAKAHGNEVIKQDAATAPNSSEVAANKQLDDGRKKKRSWTKSLFSWLKTDKKNKPMPDPKEEQSNKFNNISKVRRVNLSGPINGGGGTFKTERPRRPNSGPLTGYFNSTKRIEEKMPYIYLGRVNTRCGVQSYGPVYMVS